MNKAGSSSNFYVSGKAGAFDLLEIADNGLKVQQAFHRSLAVLNVPRRYDPSGNTKYPEECFKDFTLQPEDLPEELQDLPETFRLDSDVVLPTNSSADDVVQTASLRSYCRRYVGALFDEASAPHQLPQVDPETIAKNLENRQVLVPEPFEAKRDPVAFSYLEECILPAPIALIKRLPEAMKINMEVFSSEALRNVDNKLQVEIRYQKLQESDDNVDKDGNTTWRCESTQSFTKMQKYFDYQQNMLYSQQKFEQDENIIREPVAKRAKLSMDDTDNANVMKGGDGRPLTKETKMIKFGTNIDLSDEKKWHLQIQELNKLPNFCQISHSSNMLSHLGRTVHGMNTAQLYMKVPGSRTPAHQENNSIASINLNAGPGNCMWYGVENEYWGMMHNMCQKRGINLLTDSYWPNIQELMDEGIPVYKFEQKPGDVVWVGLGCIHWVQALGVCNNVAWNVAPMTKPQMNIICSTYERNKHMGYKSLVPVQHLFWQLAKNVSLTPELCHEVRKQLIRSLAFSKMVSDWATAKGKQIKPLEDVYNEFTLYCHHCSVEVFNVIFFKSKKAYCVFCAKDDLKTFTVRQQHKYESLQTIYDSMRLQKQKKEKKQRAQKKQISP